MKQKQTNDLKNQIVIGAKCCAQDCESEKPMQTHEGLFTSLSLGPSIPDTAEQGLGPRGGFQLSFKGWSRGPPEGVEEFLKFCSHSDMGLLRALSSVLILLWGFLPLAWALFSF